MDWKQLIHESLKEGKGPLTVTRFGEIIPSSSLWVEVRKWVKVFREYGMSPGDRVSIQVSDVLPYLGSFLASLWDGYQIMILSPFQNIKLKKGWFPADLSIIEGKIFENEEMGFSLGEDPFEESEARLIFLRGQGYMAYTDEDLNSLINSLRVKKRFLRNKVLSFSDWYRETGIIQDVIPSLIWSDLLLQGSLNWDNEKVLAMKKKYHINVVKGLKKPVKENSQLNLF